MDAIDAAAVEQVLGGDHEAFRVLVDRHSRGLFRLAFRMTGNQQDAEEVVQETFMRAFKSLKDFEARSSAATWLYRIAANQSLDLLKRRKRHATHHQVAEESDFEEGAIQVQADDPDPERLLLSREVKSRVATVMSQLTPVERVAFTMRHMEGRSIEEISKALKVRNVAARNSVFRAVQKLRRVLEPLAETR
jgi:RNA polymerase sigma-70 factor (ECF subfamily)